MKTSLLLSFILATFVLSAEETPKAFAPSTVPAREGCVQLKVVKPKGEHDLQKALRKAKEQKKFLFIQYGRENCTLCQRMWNMLGDGSIKLPADFSYADVSCDDSDTQTYFYENFVMDDAGLYYPYIVIVDPDGRQIGSCSGGQTADAVNALIKKAREDFAIPQP
ncbi:MAG: hypothetical protein RSD41_00660 [Kiritimatiellia bacterium]